LEAFEFVSSLSCVLSLFPREQIIMVGLQEWSLYDMGKIKSP